MVQFKISQHYNGQKPYAFSRNYTLGFEFGFFFPPDQQSTA